MAAIDALCQCILFSSQATAKTREWSRFQGVTCINQEKLKYYTLKNPPSTVKTPIRTCASKATTVEVGGRVYAIDPAIYVALAFTLSKTLPPYQLQEFQKTPFYETFVHLRTVPVLTLEALQERIQLVRALESKPPPENVRLRDVPLTGWIPKRTYLAGNNKWPDVVRPDANSYQFKAGKAIDVIIGNFPILSLYQEFFFRRKFVLQNAQYIFVGKDDGCTYTALVADLSDSASISGSAITAVRPSFLSFAPIVTLMKPASAEYPVKFGLLFAINEQILSYYDFPTKQRVLEEVGKNSEFIFMPAQTQQEVLENKDLPEGMGVTFPYTNGGFFSRDFIKTYNASLAQYYTGPLQIKLLRPNIPTFHPQLAFPEFSALLDQIRSQILE